MWRPIIKGDSEFSWNWHFQLLTLDASGEDSRPGYGEAIVSKLQLLHQGNVILLPAHHRVKHWLVLPSFLELRSHPAPSPWSCSSPHKQRRLCHYVGLCLSCDWTRPRCSDLFHLCPRLLRSDRLNCRHPTKILINDIVVGWPPPNVSIYSSNLRRKRPYYQLEKCHNRRSRGRSLSSRSPQPKTDTAPAQAHGPPCTRGEAAWSSRACSKVTPLLCSSLRSQITTRLHCKMTPASCSCVQFNSHQNLKMPVLS